MFPFLLYVLTALVGGFPVLLLGGMASPLSPIPASEQICLAGSMVLLAAGVVGLVRPRLAALIAFPGALGQWPSVIGGTYVLFFVLHHFNIFILVVSLFLLSVTAYSFLILSKIKGAGDKPAWLFPRNATGRAQIGVGIFFLLIVMTGLILNIFFIGVTKEILTYEMLWSYGEGTLPYYREIKLTYVKYPSYYQVCRSDELAHYLESLSERAIPVSFAVTTDFGQVRGYFLKNVGKLKVVTPVEHNWSVSGVRCDGGGYEIHRRPGEIRSGFDPKSTFMSDFPKE